jgi:hypothetical protein
MRNVKGKEEKEKKKKRIILFTSKIRVKLDYTSGVGLNEF